MKIHRFEVFLILFVAMIIADVLRQSVGLWDWDVNHMMYFGQRLLAGEFHWTQEFDDKLPVLQIIFALPAAFESFAVWRAMDLTAILAGSVAVFVLVDDILLRSWAIRSEHRLRYALIGATSSLYLAVFFHGGIHHINAPAASLSAIALAAIALSVRPQRGRYTRLALVLMSAFSASVAIGIRPYFLFPTILAAVWLYCRTIETRQELFHQLGASIVWIFLVGGFGLLVNFLPYVAIGNTEAFFSGMALLGQTLNPQNAAQVAISIAEKFAQLDTTAQVVVIISLASGFYSTMRVFRGIYDVPVGGTNARGLFLDIAVFAFAVPFVLLLSIFGRHFWPHYLQMFGPFIAIGFAMFFVLMHNQLVALNAEGKRILSALMVAYVVAIPLPSTVLALKPFLSARTVPIADQITRSLEDVVRERPTGQRSFLFLNNMYTHWKLSEPRHGYPHAANTFHIIQHGWWENLDMPAHFGHPTNAQEYCLQLETSGPSIIILDDMLREFGETCLSPSHSYSHFKDIPEFDLSIFVRRPESSS